MPTSTRALSLTVAAALFMENMDSSVIATALPAIAADLGTDPVSLKLAFTTYLLGLTVFLPLSGWAADRFGAKHVFRAAIVVFTVASLLCGLSQSLGWLVFARALQGVGGALMVPVGRIILLRAIPKSEMVDALAWLLLPALIGPLIGPPIGGFITDYFDWRWIFLMNLPFGIVGLVLASWLMPDTRGQHEVLLDVKGAILSGLGLLCTVLGLTVAGRGLLSRESVAALIAVGLVFIVAYIRHARAVNAPILDFKLFRVQTYRAGVFGGSLYRVGAGALTFLLPLMLQLGFGMSAFRSGMITATSAFGALVMKAGAARAIRRFGFRKLLLWNGVISCAFMASCALFSPSTSVVLIVMLLVAGGFFRSLQFTSMNALSYADLESVSMSSATSLYSVAQQLSLASGVAIAAFTLDASRWWRGSSDLTITDFSHALLLVSLVALCSVWQFVGLSAEAGESVSRAQPKRELV